MATEPRPPPWRRLAGSVRTPPQVDSDLRSLYAWVHIVLLYSYYPLARYWASELASVDHGIHDLPTRSTVRLTFEPVLRGCSDPFSTPSLPGRTIEENAVSVGMRAPIKHVSACAHDPTHLSDNMSSSQGHAAYYYQWAGSLRLTEKLAVAAVVTSFVEPYLVLPRPPNHSPYPSSRRRLQEYRAEVACKSSRPQAASLRGATIPQSLAVTAFSVLLRPSTEIVILSLKETNLYMMDA
ncbi:hypothetical protein C8F04DRAFT_1361359 [Mycena alexandri]|uniref:Uncharacterized protein n=1 Tax=Mycena alexandri TaxID=1745969 RepID=A0AAD6TH81_9AGAR|nr:hypothetical protein C8F04DRAFT_1361359 [Mycena alexandri]